MNLRRVVAAAAALLVLNGLAGCTSSDEMFTVSNPETGVVVEGPKRSLDGDIEAAKSDNPPAFARQFSGIGPVTYLKGKLKGDVTVTLPVPTEYKGSLEDLWIFKHNGEAWLPLMPKEVNADKRTVSITTRAFSFWTLGTWQAEEAAAQMAADLRNLTSSDGAWVISEAARLTGNAPVTECRYPALTLKLDTSQFVNKAILCPKFITEGADAAGRTTYDLHISNVQTYPVKLWLNSGVTFKSVAPAPNNPINQIMETAARTQQLVTLPGSGELVLTVRADSIPQGGVKISGSMDFTTLMLDLSFAAISTMTGFDMKGEFVRTLSASSELAGYASCVAAGSKKLADEFQQGKQGNAGEFAGKIFREGIGCLKGEVLKALLKDYYRAKGVFMSDEELAKWLAKMPARIITVLQNAPVLVSLASAVATVKHGGRTTYLLNISSNDPASDVLYKALPTPGAGGFQTAQGGNVGPANGGQLTLVGTPCMVKKQAQPWATWGLAGAYGRYVRSGIDTSVQVVYVRPEHKSAVESLFAAMVADPSKCELRETGSIVELEKLDAKQYGGLADYRVGLTGWEDSEYGHYGLVAAYDKTKGVVVFISLSADPYANISLEDIKAQLPSAMDYVANKVDVSLGTAFTFN